MRELPDHRSPGRPSELVENTHVEVVVEAGAEEGSLALCCQATSAGDLEFFARSNVLGFAEAGGRHVARERVATFEQGLALLDATPLWPRLWVIEVHRAYAAQVLLAVEARLSHLAPTPSHARSLARWRRMCGSERDR